MNVDCRTSECEGKYTNWLDVAPRSEQDRCVYITDSSGRWDAINCSDMRYYICELRKMFFSLFLCCENKNDCILFILCKSFNDKHCTKYEIGLHAVRCFSFYHANEQTDKYDSNGSPCTTHDI